MVVFQFHILGRKNAYYFQKPPLKSKRLEKQTFTIFIQKTPNILNSINLFFFFLGLSPSQKFLFFKFIKFLNLVPRKPRKYHHITKYTVKNRNYAERWIESQHNLTVSRMNWNVERGVFLEGGVSLKILKKCWVWRGGILRIFSQTLFLKGGGILRGGYP